MCFSTHKKVSLKNENFVFLFRTSGIEIFEKQFQIQKSFWFLNKNSKSTFPKVFWEEKTKNKTIFKILENKRRFFSPFRMADFIGAKIYDLLSLEYGHRCTEVKKSRRGNNTLGFRVNFT